MSHLKTVKLRQIYIWHDDTCMFKNVWYSHNNAPVVYFKAGDGKGLLHDVIHFLMPPIPEYIRRHLDWNERVSLENKIIEYYKKEARKLLKTLLTKQDDGSWFCYLLDQNIYKK